MAGSGPGVVRDRSGNAGRGCGGRVVVANDPHTGRSIQRSFTMHGDAESAEAYRSDLVERFAVDKRALYFAGRGGRSPNCWFAISMRTTSGSRPPVRRTGPSGGSWPPTGSPGSAWPVCVRRSSSGRWPAGGRRGRRWRSCGGGGRSCTRRCRGPWSSGICGVTRWRGCVRRRGPSPQAPPAWGGGPSAGGGR